MWSISGRSSCRRFVYCGCGVSHRPYEADIRRPAVHQCTSGRIRPRHSDVPEPGGPPINHRLPGFCTTFEGSRTRRNSEEVPGQVRVCAGDSASASYDRSVYDSFRIPCWRGRTLDQHKTKRSTDSIFLQAELVPPAETLCPPCGFQEGG